MPDDDRRASDCSADKAASAMHSIDAVEWGSSPLIWVRPVACRTPEVYS